MVKEVQGERDATQENKPLPITPVVPVVDNVPEAEEERPRRALPKISALLKLILLGAVVFLVIHSLAGVVSSFKKKETPPPVIVSKEEKATQAIEEASAGTGLRLVGVDWGEPPVALLEDLVTGKTYFARKNERVKGSRVKQILKDKVLVSFHGKDVELQ